jgi:hypothetical protein
MTCLEFKELARYVAGDLSPERANEFEHHVARCDRCAKQFEELAAATSRLAPDVCEFDDPAFADDVMTLIKLGRAKPGRTVEVRSDLRWRWALASAVAAVLVISFVALLPLIWQTGQQSGTAVSVLAPQPDESGFQARGVTGEQPDRWVSLHVYRASPKGYIPVEERLATDDALAFAYEDRSPEPYRYLMVFAVDESGEVFWYYPAYLREAEIPQSVRISQHPGPVQLPEEVRHELGPGKLRIFALFVRKTLDVATVEGLISHQLNEVEGNLDSLTRLPVADSGQYSRLLQVRKRGGEQGR